MSLIVRASVTIAILGLFTGCFGGRVMDPLPVINKDSDSELSCQQIEVEMDIGDRKARASATRAEQTDS